MTKELARYFLTLIDRDVYFSFNGMGLPNSACEWLENQLMQENFDKVEEFIKLRYTEQSEKAIKKHKFRAMTNREFCNMHNYCRTCPERKVTLDSCYKVMHGEISGMAPYRTKDGKYILIERYK